MKEGMWGRKLICFLRLGFLSLRVMKIQLSIRCYHGCRMIEVKYRRAEVYSERQYTSEGRMQEL